MFDKNSLKAFVNEVQNKFKHMHNDTIKKLLEKMHKEVKCRD